MPLGIIVVENNVNLEEVRTHITRLHEVRLKTFLTFKDNIQAKIKEQLQFLLKKISFDSYLL